MCLFAATSCSDPDFNTDLTTEGPPEILSVTVLSEGVGDESATFCADPAGRKIPEAFCPNDGTVADAVPMGWYSRIIFDELLNADVESLIEVDGAMVGSLATTQPVTLLCGGDPVAYDGFYDPAGNAVTFPPGPALVIEPTAFVATGTACTLEVKTSVVDKQGVALESGGPFTFSIAGLAYAGSDPEDEAEGVDPAAEVLLIFNAPIDMATLGTKITLTDAAMAAVAATVAVDPDDASIVIITPAAALDENAVYTVTITSATADPIADVGGGTVVLADPITFSFTTGMAAPPDAA
jgi:hypothetical protein